MKHLTPFTLKYNSFLPSLPSKLSAIDAKSHLKKYSIQWETYINSHNETVSEINKANITQVQKKDIYTYKSSTIFKENAYGQIDFHGGYQASEIYFYIVSKVITAEKSQSSVNLAICVGLGTGNKKVLTGKSPLQIAAEMAIDHFNLSSHHPVDKSQIQNKGVYVIKIPLRNRANNSNHSYLPKPRNIPQLAGGAAEIENTNNMSPGDTAAEGSAAAAATLKTENSNNMSPGDTALEGSAAAAAKAAETANINNISPGETAAEGSAAEAEAAATPKTQRQIKAGDNEINFFATSPTEEADTDQTSDNESKFSPT